MALFCAFTLYAVLLPISTQSTSDSQNKMLLCKFCAQRPICVKKSFIVSAGITPMHKSVKDIYHTYQQNSYTASAKIDPYIRD